MKRKTKAHIGLTIKYIVLILLTVVMLFPLAWMLTVALKSSSGVYTFPPQWIPKEFHWENFSKAIDQTKYWQKFFNTTIITVTATIGQVLSCMIVAYPLARIKFPGRRVWFYMIIASMMLPSMVSFLPIFKLWTALGWYNTWLPLIVPAWLGGPFYTFLLRQYYTSIPTSFDEAAKIDGANHWQILFRIIAPMSLPAITVIVIGQALASWNDYFTPLIYLMDQNKWTLSLIMATFTSQYATVWNLYMAIALLYMIPTLLLFFFCQKYFMQGLGSLNSAALK